MRKKLKPESKPCPRFRVVRVAPEIDIDPTEASHLAANIFVVGSFTTQLMDERYVRGVMRAGMTFEQRKGGHAERAVLDYLKREPVPGMNDPATDPDHETYLALVRLQ